MPKAMVRSGRSGWYYRVLAPGTIRAGDALRLEERPHPDFLFSRLVQIVSFGGATQDELLRMTTMKGLARQWQRRAREALAGIDPR
jgi:MOSC domain-containing protein YiiM